MTTVIDKSYSHDDLFELFVDETNSNRIIKSDSLTGRQIGKTTALINAIKCYNSASDGCGILVVNQVGFEGQNNLMERIKREHQIECLSSNRMITLINEFKASGEVPNMFQGYRNVSIFIDEVPVLIPYLNDIERMVQTGAPYMAGFSGIMPSNYII